MKYYVRRMALIVAIVMLSATLSGCSGQPATPAATQVPNPTATVIPTAEPTSATDNGVAASTLVTATNPLSVEGLDATQLNSINMLNHLVVLSQEINASKNSRLYLTPAVKIHLRKLRYSHFTEELMKKAYEPAFQDELRRLI